MGGALCTNRIFIFSHFLLRFRQVARFGSITTLLSFPPACDTYTKISSAVNLLPGLDFRGDYEITQVLRQQSGNKYEMSQPVPKRITGINA